MLKDVDKAISYALERRPQLGLTSSFQINTETVADNTQFHEIDGPHWQVIFGRRGAGKTTLLATHAKYITADKAPEASIEVNVPDFISRIERGSDAPLNDQTIAQVYFSDFMKFVASHLFRVFSERSPKSKFFRLFEISEKKRYIEDIVSRIHDSTEHRQSIQHDAMLETSFDESTSRTDQSAFEGGLAINATLGTDKPPAAGSSLDLKKQAKLISEGL